MADVWKPKEDDVVDLSLRSGLITFNNHVVWNMPLLSVYLLFVLVLLLLLNSFQFRSNSL